MAENAWNKTYALQHAVRDVWEGYEQSNNVILVGHGMGGLLGKYYLKETPTDHHVARFVTLGTPHWGTIIS